MAIPTITLITPSVGHTGGKHIAEIEGTNFSVPQLQPQLGRVRDPVPTTVRVTFGGAAAVVQVASSTLLWITVPPTPLPLDVPPELGEGSVDVVVQHLDPVTGADVVGEVATLVDGYTYRRPQLAQSHSTLERVVERLAVVMASQTIPEVVLSTSLDWDSDTTDGLNITDIAKVPAFVLIGPDLVRSGVRDANVPIVSLTTDPLISDVRRPAQIRDLAFELVGISDEKMELLALIALIEGFFKKNATLDMLRDPTDSSKGTVSFSMGWAADGEPKTAPAFGAKSNVRSFSGRFVVHGVPIEDLVGFSTDDVVAKVAKVTQDPTIISVQKT